MDCKKVAILGFAEGYKRAPFADASWEIWGLNELYLHIPRWDRWFEMHSRERIETDKLRTDDHLTRLRNMTTPIYMQEHYADIPSSISYPLQEVMAQVGNYLTSTVSYMLALAILEGYEEIGLWGVNMAFGTEYAEQRPSCEYFVGLARGRGIKVHIPLESNLLKALYLYGYQEAEEVAFRANLRSRREDLQQRFEVHRQQHDAAQSALDQVGGAIQNIDCILRTWGNI